MSAKNTSHDAAQHKVWKADLKTLDAAQRKVLRDFTAARRPLAKAVQTATARLAAYDKRAAKQQPRALSNIQRRRGILHGKLGIPFIP
jgi:hypothetical protein